VSLLHELHREITAMRAALAAAMTTASAAHEHAGRITHEANALGFLEPALLKWRP
jgi:hypothetical protein